MAVVNVIPETLAKYVDPTAALAAAKGWIADNGTWIKKLIDQHKAWINEEGVETYQAAYDGYLEKIDTRDKSRGDDTNHKLQVNYAELVIDAPVDYMLGKPIVWTVEDPDGEADKKLIEQFRKDFLALVRNEEAQRILAEQLRQGGIGGYSPIIGWVDENGDIDYDEFPIQEVIPVYDTRGRLALVIRYYIVEDTTEDDQIVTRTRVEVYDDRYVTYYISVNDGEGYELDEAEAETGNPVEHKAGRIPVSIFVNGTPARYEKRQKKNGVSDLANGVLSLLENYAEGMSDKANYVDYLQDAYLLLSGVDVDQNEVLKMRKARAIALKAKESTATFISQSQEDKAVESHLDRVKKTIHDMAKIPQLNDLQGATATEIKLKYACLDIKAGKKELYFSSAIKQLVKVLTDLLNARRLADAGVDDAYDILTGRQKPPKSVVLYNHEWVAFTINRNLPQNFLEIAQIVAALADKVPDAYLYELLWFIDDPVKALEDMKKQREESAKQGLTAMGLGGEFSSTGNNGGNTNNDDPEGGGSDPGGE